MSNLLSLDLTSALRTAVEQSMPRLRNDPVLNANQVASRSVSSGSFAAPVSHGETETHKDRVTVRGTDLATLATVGLLSTEPMEANAHMYTSQAQVVTGMEFYPRSTFMIIA
jgi:hypothetical protein